MNVRALWDGFRTPDGLAILFLATLPLVYFFPAVFGGIVLCPTDGIILNVPLRVAAAEMMRDGQLPLWNPYIFSGMPLFAAAQAGVLFPLNWPFLALSPAAAMNFTVLSAYSLAGVGAFLYARRIGANIAGGLVTAVVWQASGFMVAHLGHTNIVHVGSLLPWLLWSIDGYGMTRRRGRGALVAVIVALLVFAGHPNMLAYALLLAGSYALVLGLMQPEPGTRRAYLESLGLIVGGVALGAVQILPTLELLRLSLRSGADYEFFASYSLPPQFLRASVAPYIFGAGDGHFFRAPYVGEPHYTEYIGYVGLLPLMLTLSAPFAAWDRRTIFWIGATLICCALCLGRFLPFDLYRLIYHLPVLNLFRVPARHLMEVNFALAVLAGRAVTSLPAMQPRSRRRLLVGAAGGIIFGLTAAVVTVWRPERFSLPGGAPVSVVSAPELFVPLILGGVSVWALVRLARGRRYSAALVVLVSLIDLCVWGQFSGWRVESPRFGDQDFYGAAVANFLREREGPRLGKYRILGSEERLSALSATPAGDYVLPQGLAWWAGQHDLYMIHRVESAAGLDAFGLARYSALAGDMKVWGSFPDSAQSLHVGRALDLLNVRYFISPAESATGPEPTLGRWQPVGTVENVVVHENPAALPRTWVVAEARPVDDPQKLEIIRTGKFPDGTEWDPRQTALVDHSLPELRAPSAATGESEIIKYEPALIDVAANLQGPGLLVLSENYYPGWRAMVDGAPARILRVNYNLRAVVLSAGKHHVRFVFSPRSFYIGLLISVLAAAALAVWLFLPSRRFRTLS